METSIEDLPAFDLDWPHAFGVPAESAIFRQSPEDFRVDEDLGFTPCGEGEHVYLHIRKRGDNTEWVARQIARLAEVQPMDIGYCGLKDRQAVTSQWFSVYLPLPKSRASAVPDWNDLNSDSLQVLTVSRHRQKLRRGVHRSNRFEIRLRRLSAQPDDSRLAAIFDRGIPNYFGPQRFGHNGNNLVVADALLTGQRRIKNRQKRGLMLSAARAYLYNRVLAARVAQACWRDSLEGEPLGATPSGPLWGRGRSLAAGQTLALESAALAPYREWCDALEHVGLSQERRPLLLTPEAGSWRKEDSDLTVSFGLPPGTYATAVLREIACLQPSGGTESTAGGQAVV